MSSDAGGQAGGDHLALRVWATWQRFTALSDRFEDSFEVSGELLAPTVHTLGPREGGYSWQAVYWSDMSKKS